MSYAIKLSELNNKQVVDIHNKLTLERSLGRGRTRYQTFYEKCEIDGETHVIMPMAIKAMMNEEGIGEYIDITGNKANRELIHDRISGQINDNFKLRGDQPEIIESALNSLRNYSTCLLDLSCSFGKTCMSIYLGQMTRYKWLFVTPRKILKTQTLRDAEKVTSERVQILHSKNVIDPKATGYIISSHILKRYEYEDFEGIGTLILDEVHMLLTEGFLPNLFELFPRYLIGFSATPDRKDGMDMAIPLYIDKRSYIKASLTKPMELIKVNTSLKFKIKMNQANDLDWTYIMQQQAECNWRNDIIAYLAKKFSELKPLVLCLRKSQVTSIYGKVRDMGIKCDIVMANRDTYDRECDVLVAIASKIGVGFDGDFNCVILASDITDIRQIVGRIGRHIKEKDMYPLIIDIVDEFITMKKHFTSGRLPQYVKYYGINGYKTWIANNGYIIVE